MTSVVAVDCEFNGFNGELISMALVADDGREWYESVGCAEPVAWVHENVMPVIHKDAVTYMEYVASLERFLRGFAGIRLIADWPEDIAWFCRSLIFGPGHRIDAPPITMEIHRWLTSEYSEIPHNALEDARAIMALWKKYPE